MRNLLKLSLILSAISLAGCASLDDSYLKIGAGYKVDETEIRYDDGSKEHPLGARIEVGMEKGAVSYGVAHYSQWLSGWPVNDDTEYARTEIFIDYKFKYKD